MGFLLVDDLSLALYPLLKGGLATILTTRETGVKPYVKPDFHDVRQLWTIGIVETGHGILVLKTPALGVLTLVAATLGTLILKAAALGILVLKAAALG